MSITWVENFLWGSLLIVRVFAVALVLTVVWGMLGASAKLSKNWLLQRVAGIYTSVFRGTPGHDIDLASQVGQSNSQIR